MPARSEAITVAARSRVRSSTPGHSKRAFALRIIDLARTTSPNFARDLS